MPIDPAYKQLIDQLHSLQGDALRKAERKALTASGDLIEAALIEAAPEQAGVPEGLLKPGELKASIKASVRIASDAKVADTGKGSYVLIRPTDSTARTVAGWVEHGHNGPRSDSRKTPAHPFIRPTEDATLPEAIETYTTIMTEEITKVLE